MPESILDLAVDQPQERAFITVDGDRVELAEPDDFSMIEAKVMQRDLARLMKLEEQETITEAEQDEYNVLVDKLLHQVVPEIGERAERIRRSQRVEILQAFFVAARARRRMVAPTEDSTSSTLSPD